MPDRRGSAMYDPARNAFVSPEPKSDEAAPQLDRVDELPADEEASKDPSSNSKPEQPANMAASSSSPKEAPQSSTPPPPTMKRAAESPSEPAAKKTKTSPAEPAANGHSAKPATKPSKPSELPRIRKKAPQDKDKPRPPRRSRSPEISTRRQRSRSPARRPIHDLLKTQTRQRTRSPSPIRDPTPPPDSPPRQRKRPGASSRISQRQREANNARQREREAELSASVKNEIAARGVHDVVTQHYNTVKQYGRDWRRTDSKIKGLRSFNNWVKSTLIHKFSPREDFTPGAAERGRWEEGRGQGQGEGGLLVMDIGCGKGGDLQKWASAPQRVDLYVGADPAEVSIEQARGRYVEMKGGKNGKRPRRIFHGEFVVKDCYGESLAGVPIVKEVGFDSSVGPGGNIMAQRFGGGGFDVVTMMFCMHYAFESEEKARGMLRNVAGSLRKGGRFIGVIPNSDVLSAKVEEYHKANGTAPNGAAASDNDDDGRPSFADSDDEGWDPEKSLDTGPTEEEKKKQKEKEDEPEEEGEVKSDSLEWGNSIYRVKFPNKTPTDGVFRPPFGWKYFYFLEEAVEEVPEYVVPWEMFRALAEDYNLELQYRKPFNQVWDEEEGDPVLGPLSERMNVRGRDRGPLLISPEEMDAAAFYHAFCFYKV